METHKIDMDFTGGQLGDIFHYRGFVVRWENLSWLCDPESEQAKYIVTGLQKEKVWIPKETFTMRWVFLGTVLSVVQSVDDWYKRFLML